MQHRLLPGRLFGNLFLLIALLASAAAIPVGAAQDTTPTTQAQTQGAGASVEVHKRLCPTGYSDNNFFADCHDTPADGVTFELGNLRDTTGTDGNVRFFNLLGGTYTITESVPGDVAEKVIYCTFGGDPSAPASFDYVAGGIRLNVPSGAEIFCDWYNVPYDLRSPGNGDGENGASVTIHARRCPADFTGTDVYAVCHDNPLPGATFTLDGLTATTGEDGNTLFYQLNPGTYTIRQAGQGEFWYFNVFCSPTADLNQDVPVTRVPNGIQLEVEAGASIICDWYNTPEPGSGNGEDPNEAGQLTLHKVECPPGYQGQQFYQDCHDNRLQGVSFDALGPEGYLRMGVVSNSQGIVNFDGIGVGGTVSVREDLPEGTAYFVVYCADEDGDRVPFRYVENAPRTGIDVDIFRGDDVLCDWYNVPAA